VNQFIGSHHLRRLDEVCPFIASFAFVFLLYQAKVATLEAENKAMQLEVEALEGKNENLLEEVRETKRVAIDLAKDFATKTSSSSSSPSSPVRGAVLPERLREAGGDNRQKIVSAGVDAGSGAGRSVSRDTLDGLEAQAVAARMRGEDDVAQQLEETLELWKTQRAWALEDHEKHPASPSKKSSKKGKDEEEDEGPTFGPAWPPIVEPSEVKPNALLIIPVRLLL
jgi:hypothetical protein